jgi:ATP-dependent RNA helicase DDX31/DBP7
MADDGLLLNLNFGEGPAAPKVTKVKGGRWKDRLKNKRDQQRALENEHPEFKAARAAREARIAQRKEKEAEQVPKEPNKRKLDGAEDERQTKIRRQDKPKGHQKNGVSGKDRPAKKKQSTGENSEGKKRQFEVEDGKTFVSSLFSSNPEAPENEPTEEIHPGQASNAPLTDATTFEGLRLNKQLSQIVTEKMKMSQPTRIQRAALPILISSDRDLLIQAQTGSGKTLAYVLPILHRLMSARMDRNLGLFAVVLAPTRELSAQIYSVLEQVVRGCHWIVPGIVTGGEKKKAEKARIRKGINILVATPGRLADHFDNTESLDLSNVRWVVLDEGDRLMELGFEETITKILTRIGKASQIRETTNQYPGLPKKRVNVLCSATMKGDVERLGEISLSNAVWVTPDDAKEECRDADHVAPAQLIQESVIVPAKLRLVTLAGLLMHFRKTRPRSRMMVFFSCSDSVDFHFEAFTREGKDPRKTGVKEDDDNDGNVGNTVLTSPELGGAVIHKLHGSLNQQIRTSTLAAFSSKTEMSTASILFCTDVASRGLDLPMITNIVEYDPPFASGDHVHRVGRTARAGHEGSSIIFLLPGIEQGYLEIIKPNHPTGIVSRSYQDILKQAFGGKWETDATTWHLDCERWLLEDPTALQQAKRAFTSHIRAYATHLSSEREVFNLRSLHLGHIAKSFALRETPGAMSNKPTKSARRPKSDKVQPWADGSDSRKKMLDMARKHAGMNEFNLG